MKSRLPRLAMPAPRLLPMTIVMLAAVLATKSFLLVRSAFVPGQTGLIAAAQAGHGAPTPAPAHGAKPETKPAPPAHGAKPEAKPAHGAEKPPEAVLPEPKPTAPEGPPPVSESEKAVLLELRERRKALEEREAALASRESMSAAAEGRISARVEEMQGLQKRLETLDAGRRQQEDNAWQGLVKVYETMKPRDAAAIFNDLAMPVLVSVMGRMKEAKAAAVLAAMLPDKAREVTTQLALTRTRAADPNASPSPPMPSAAKPPAAGG